MTLPPQNNANPQRSATRAPIEVEVRVQFDDSLDVHVGRCFNISIGGLFLETDQMRPNGSLVRIEVVLPEGAVRGLAEVVWSQGPLPGRAGGLGLKFRFLEQRDRQLIFKLVSQHIKDRLAQRPPLADEPPPSPNTPLARQRRASLLGEGLPAPPLPTLATTSSTPRLIAVTPVAGAAPGRVMDERFPSTPVAEDLVVRTGAAPLPILRDDSRSSPLAPPAASAGLPAASSLEDRTWPSARQDEEDWQIPELEQAEAPGLADLPMAQQRGVDLDYDEDLPPAEGEKEGHHYFDGPDSGLRRRAAPRRRLPLIVIPLLLLLLALGYFVGTRLWHSVRGEEAPLAPEPPSEILHIGTSGPASTPAPTPAPPPTQPTQAEPSQAEPTQPEPTVSTDGGGEPAAETSEPLSTPTPTPPPAPAPNPPPASRDQAVFHRIVAIRWDKIPEGVEVIIETDGRIPDQRFDKFRLEGATPREVIRFYGVDKKFEQDQLTVGSIYLQQIRLGWHTGKPKGNELHVVLDVGNNAKIAQVRNLGKSLAVQVKKR